MVHTGTEALVVGGRRKAKMPDMRFGDSVKSYRLSVVRERLSH